MRGYDKTKEEPAPTIRYINEIKQLGYPKLNKIALNLEKRFDEISIVNEKIKYGLEVTNKEISEFKRGILR